MKKQYKPIYGILLGNNYIEKYPKEFTLIDKQMYWELVKRIENIFFVELENVQTIKNNTKFYNDAEFDTNFLNKIYFKAIGKT